MYACSIRTLSRRLQFFEIKYINYNMDVDEIKQAVEVEFQGPGKLLDYRALHQKIPELHRLNVPRNLVYDVMVDISQCKLLSQDRCESSITGSVWRRK